jgi:hypothetical protein
MKGVSDMRITVCSPRSGNDPEIHKAGCADIKRGISRGKYQGAYSYEAASQTAVAKEFWESIYQETADNDGITEAEALEMYRVNWTRFLPCVKDLPEH